MESFIYKIIFIVFQLVDVQVRFLKKVQKLIIRYGRIYKYYYGYCCYGDYEEDSDEECYVYSDGSEVDLECDRYVYMGVS